MTGDNTGEATALYNMTPEPGYPAEFGFTFADKPVLIYASLARVNGTYRLRTVSSGIVQLGVDSTSLFFYGDPAEHDGGLTSSSPFFTNPSACTTEPLTASISADSWEHPGAYTQPLESTVYHEITGFELLSFRPTLRALPDTTQADAPAGYEVNLEVPQREGLATPATPDLKNATVALPRGVSLNAAAADGLAACRETGPDGINIEGPESTEVGEGVRDHSPYDDEQEHLARGHCPAASTIGSVEVNTPVLPAPLTGHLYVAQPRCGGRTAGMHCPGRDERQPSGVPEAGSGAIVKPMGRSAAPDGAIDGLRSAKPPVAVQ
jgi:hypothetical protein